MITMDWWDAFIICLIVPVFVLAAIICAADAFFKWWSKRGE